MFHSAVHRESSAHPANMSHATAKKRAAPYNKIVEVVPQMRKETVTFIKQAVEENRKVYVLVTNRSEGNAPLTVQALLSHLRHEAE